jgi:hypothetical protein
MGESTETSGEQAAKELLDRFSSYMTKAGHTVVVAYDANQRVTIDGIEMGWRVALAKGWFRLVTGVGVQTDVFVPKRGPLRSLEAVQRALKHQRAFLAEKAKHDAVAVEAARLKQRFGADGFESSGGSVVDGIVIGSSTVYSANHGPCVTLAMPKLRGSPQQIEAVLVAIEAAGLLPKARA